MTPHESVPRALDTAGRRGTAACVIAVTYVAANLVASTMLNPAHPRALAAVPVLLAGLAGLIGAVTIGPLAHRLPLPTGQRLAVVACMAYLLSTGSNEIEALLFIKGSSPLILVTGAVLALGLAVPVVLAWPSPGTVATTVGTALRETLNSRPWWSWIWRVSLASLLWVPVYFVFAAADAPFVHIYYHQTGTTFTIPSNGVLATAELARGLLHALVLAALAALLNRSRRVNWFWLALAFATLNAWLPLVQRSDWPYYLRAANLVEITCDAVCYGGLVVLLLARKRGLEAR